MSKTELIFLIELLSAMFWRATSNQQDFWWRYINQTERQLLTLGQTEE